VPHLYLPLTGIVSNSVIRQILITILFRFERKDRCHPVIGNGHSPMIKWLLFMPPS